VRKVARYARVVHGEDNSILVKTVNPSSVARHVGGLDC